MRDLPMPDIGSQFRHALRALAVMTALLAPTAMDVAHAAGETGALRAREAAAALHKNQAVKAVQLYTEALTDAGLPNDRRAAIHNDRGVAHARLNQTRAAIDDFNRAVQLFPESASAYNNRGNVLLAVGLTPEAIKDFDRAIVLAPGYAAAYSNRATALAKIGETDAAIRDFSQSSRLSPQNPAPLAGRGRLLLVQKRPHAALRDLNRALASDSRFGPGYRLRADIKMALLRYDEAIEDLGRAVTFDPTHLDTYVLRGHAYLAAQKTSDATKDFARAAEIDAKSAAAWTGLGLAKLHAETFDDALTDLGKALDLEPQSAVAYAYRAIVYKRMGQPDLGQRDLDRALKLEPGAAEVAWARGELAEAAGRNDEAVSELRKALAINPSMHLVASSLDRLGVPRADEVELRDLAFEGWRVFVRQGRFVGLHADLGPKFVIPLETAGGSQPKLLEWDVKAPPYKGLAVLTFHAGQQEGRSGPEDIVHAAVLDVAARKLIAVETVREGARAATWTWDESKLAVTGIDGHLEEYTLKAQKDLVQAPAPRRVASPDGFSKQTGPPAWAPWAQNYGSGQDYRRPPQQQSKSLFDLLFKKN